MVTEICGTRDRQATSKLENNFATDSIEIVRRRFGNYVARGARRELPTKKCEQWLTKRACRTSLPTNCCLYFYFPIGGRCQVHQVAAVLRSTSATTSAGDFKNYFDTFNTVPAV